MTHTLRGLNVSIYKSRNLMLEYMRLCHVTHSIEFSLFRVLYQQNLHLYQSISSLN